MNVGERLLRADPIDPEIPIASTNPSCASSATTPQQAGQSVPAVTTPQQGGQPVPAVTTPQQGGQPILATWGPYTVPKGCNRAYLAAVALQSAKKCEDLLDITGVAVRGNTLFFDLTTTALSALATALTPLVTVHALSAAASISSGTRANIDSDLYAKQTASIIADQINSTYFSEIKKYADKLSKGKDEDFTPAVEVLEIATIHRQCNIDQALAALASKARQPAPPPQTPPACPQTEVTAKDLPAAGQTKTVVSPLNCIEYSVMSNADGTVTITPPGRKTPERPMTVDTFLKLINPVKPTNPTP